MSQAAIIGIACGAAALFTLSTVLFVVYYLQQRRFDEDMQRRRGSYWNSNYTSSWEPRTILPAAEDRPQFTLDYKSGPEPIATRQTSSTSRREPSQSFTGVSQGRGVDHMASSMPAHPAYLPRAVMRPSRSPPATTDQFPLRSLPPHQRRGSQPDDFILRAYLAGADGAPTPAAEHQDFVPPPQAYELADEALPNLATPASTATASTPRTFSRTTRSSRVASSYDEPSEASTPRKLSLLMPGPTPLHPPPYAPVAPPPTSGWVPTREARGGDMPIAGLEDVTISGPLAFADVATGCQRSFRDRVAASPPPPPPQHMRRPSDGLRRERGIWRLSARDTYRRDVRLSVDEEDLYG